MSETENVTPNNMPGAAAPAAEARVRANAHNVVEIHQEAVELSYTELAMGNRGNYGTTARGASPVLDEMAFQMDQQLKQVARDIEVTFISGTFQEPADNVTPRKTRGLIEAIVTNVTDLDNAGSDGPLTEAAVLDTMQAAWESGGLQEGETRTVITGAVGKRSLTKIFVTGKGYTETSRNVGGVNLQVIETDFGNLNVMLNRHMPSDTLIFASLEDLAPRFLAIPGKGYFFWEPLAKTGASEKSQLYGEIGLEYGNERKHAKIINAAAAA
jgi:hypothetical protein